MSPSKILIGQFLIVLSIIVLTLWGATQWVAHELGYQAALGRPWFVLDGQPVYRPWRLFQWWYAYEAYAPEVFAKGGAISASGGLLGILAAVVGSVWRSRWERRVTTYGSSRWAGRRDLVRARLLGGDGVFLGTWKGKYLRHDGPEHVLAFAPTRSGKGVGLVVPTLLSWTGSAVIHDVKGENWDLTSGWRSKLGPCIRFDPTDVNSPRYNPLMEVRRGPNEVRDVQNIADILVDPEGSLERRSHWEKTGHALLVGVILHVLYAEKDKTLAGCASFLSDPSRPFKETLSRMMNTKHLARGDGARSVHPVVAQAARELLNKAENERSGVLSTALSFLSLYRDPVVAAVTSESDWRISDLVEGARPVSLYLVVPPSDLSRTKPLMRLGLNQIGRRLTAFMAGYGVRSFLIAQSLNQIEKAYGPNNAILDNCHVRVAFATNDERTAKRISEALGTKTEQRSQKNYTGHRLAPWLSHMMVSRQETQRQLLTPGEIMQLPPDREVVMVSGAAPVLADKLRYFEDRNFTTRVLSPAACEPDDSKNTSEWSDFIAEQGFEEGSMATVSDDDAGRELRHQLEREDVLSHNIGEPGGHEVEDDPADPAVAQHLDAVRQALALDEVDQDVIPGW